MPVINLGVSYDDIKNLDEWIVVPGGTYQFNVASIDEKTSAKGRPMLNWRLQVSDPITAKPVSIFYNTVLPYIDETNTMNVKGCGMLVSVCKAVGLPWTGQSINTEDYIGRTGQVTIKVTKAQKKNPASGEYEDDPDGKERNEVDKFVY